MAILLRSLDVARVVGPTTGLKVSDIVSAQRQISTSLISRRPQGPDVARIKLRHCLCRWHDRTGSLPELIGEKAFIRYP